MIDLVNGIQVSKDLIRYRKNRGFFGQLLDTLDGSDRKRQLLLDGNLIAGQEALYQWVLELSDSLRVSQVVLEVIQQSLLEARDAIRRQKQRLQMQEEALLALSQGLDLLAQNVLLASAAIPLAFPQREINGQFYVDGALGDNIPLGALAARGCTHAIVIHLGNGETWNRHDFSEQTIIEIRPEQRINTFDTPILGSVSSLLDFSSDRIAELKRRGYQDARRCLEPIIQTFQAVRSHASVS